MGGVMSGVKSGASHLVDGAKAQAVGAVEQRKTTAAESLGNVAGALREAAQKLEEGAGPLGSYAGGAADQVDKVARYLREKDLQALARDTETFARRHPEVFLGGAFLAGVLAARFLKSSSQRREPGGQGELGDQPGYGGGYTAGAYDRGYNPTPSGGYTGGTGAYAGGYAGGTAGAPDSGSAYSSGSSEPFNTPHLEPSGGQ